MHVRVTVVGGRAQCQRVLANQELGHGDGVALEGGEMKGGISTMRCVGQQSWEAAERRIELGSSNHQLYELRRRHVETREKYGVKPLKVLCEDLVVRNASRG